MLIYVKILIHNVLNEVFKLLTLHFFFLFLKGAQETENQLKHTFAFTLFLFLT